MKQCQKCERPSKAKGLCSTHYNQTQTNRHVKVMRPCTACGTPCLKEKRDLRYLTVQCGSQLCRYWIERGAWHEPWSKAKPAVRLARKHPKIPGSLVAGKCQDCEQPFIAMSRTGLARFCSDQCAGRSSRRTRRAREHNAPGTFRFSDIMRQYRKQGSVCAYCEQPCDGLPDPEHVVPLSRGGRNDMSNLVAACRLCNSDKCDLTLEQWAEDRARRHLPLVNTNPHEDRTRYPLLMRYEASSEAQRHLSAAA
jgi:hypothetical protein